MQGLGFVDEVEEAHVRAIVEAAQISLTHVEPFALTLDRPRITPEAIRWEAQPPQPVAAVRDRIRAAKAECKPSLRPRGCGAWS
ncbi:2'-5' RNA ligase family protein [Nonomuraea sp. C10]|jgi:hypothetical protein|uniref:2'-5' RNA ligase family protein n=1 Tax=Nonomuraea sp. C10 TaxID=2600577 RepID=UPI001C9C05A9|nr:2'-5' RNA ligase family protein [Nonomuraea sp. C10]